MNFNVHAQKNFKERYNEMKKLIALVAVFSVAATLRAVPAEFSYQGVLRDTNDAPLTGNRTVELRLYGDPTGDSVLWGRAYSVLLDANGLFNIEVSDSSGSPLDPASNATLESVFSETSVLYVGLKLTTSSGEIRPRQKLLPVPFAAVAGDVSRASGNFTVSGRLTAQNAQFSGDLTATNLNVTASVAANSLRVTGNATVEGDLTVVGGAISGFGSVPIGGIIMWSGAENQIPEGWVLCNGNNGTPDLRGRFVVGAGGNYRKGDVGGSDNVALTVSQIPSHSHSYKFTSASHSGIFYNDRDTFYFTGNSGVAKTKETLSAGSGQVHENRPPYYALCFIMRKE